MDTRPAAHWPCSSPAAPTDGAEKRTLLLVDDEDNILRALVRVLRREGYNILRAGSGLQALELLARHPVGVIISDQRMPHMTGVEFLRRVRELYPDTVRIVLSGYTDLESVTDAINEGAIYKFLTKPWDDELLRRNVREAFARYELEHENRRLADELRKANAALSQVNRELERRVQERTRELTVHLKALQVHQEVFEHLPVAVVGIDPDGLIVVCNRRAQRLFSPAGAALIGASAEAVLPPPVRAAVNSFPPGACLRHGGVADCFGTPCALTISPMAGASAERGLILTLHPVTEGAP